MSEPLPQPHQHPLPEAQAHRLTPTDAHPVVADAAPTVVSLSAAEEQRRRGRNRVLAWVHVGLAIGFLILFVIIQSVS